MLGLKLNHVSKRGHSAREMSQGIEEDPDTFDALATRGAE